MPGQFEIYDLDSSRVNEIEQSFSNIKAKFDEAEKTLLGAYGRYMERPSSRKMKNITKASADCFNSFGNLLVYFDSNKTDAIDERFRPKIIASLLCDASRERARLFADDSINEEDHQEAVRLLAELLELFDNEALIESALDHFCEIQDKDMQTIEQFIINYTSSPREQVKTRLYEGSIDIAKIGSGSLVALVIFDKFFK